MLSMRLLYYPVMAILTTKEYPSFGPTIYQKSVGYRAGLPYGIKEQNNSGNSVYVAPEPSLNGIFHFR